jgi:hypothetical protein
VPDRTVFLHRTRVSDKIRRDRQRRPRLCFMTAAFDHEDLHHLVDRLTPQQVRRLRLLVHEDPELPDAGALEVVSPDDGARLAGLIGAIHGPADLAERHDGYVRDRFSAPA